jgi:hypothetical protein
MVTKTIWSMTEEKYIKLVIDLKAEYDSLVVKFGSNNKIAKKIAYQIQVMADFYDEQENQRTLNHLMKVNYISSQMIRSKSKMTYENQAKLNGFDVEKWRLLDTIDKQINSIKKMMNES